MGTKVTISIAEGMWSGMSSAPCVPPTRWWHTTQELKLHMLDWCLVPQVVSGRQPRVSLVRYTVDIEMSTVAVVGGHVVQVSIACVSPRVQRPQRL